jgi:diketogulonate reductase-like aldo/keto reductase
VAAVPPVVDQVQFSPFKYRRALLEACEQRGVTLDETGGTSRALESKWW